MLLNRFFSCRICCVVGGVCRVGVIKLFKWFVGMNLGGYELFWFCVFVGKLILDFILEFF